MKRTTKGAVAAAAAAVLLLGGAGAEGGTLASFVTTSVASAEIDDVATTTFTEDNDGDILDIVVAVDFPFGSAVDNDSQTKTLDLTNLTVDITQTDATP